MRAISAVSDEEIRALEDIIEIAALQGPRRLNDNKWKLFEIMSTFSEAIEISCLNARLSSNIPMQQLDFPRYRSSTSVLHI